jgi:hypothetical protein
LRKKPQLSAVTAIAQSPTGFKLANSQFKVTAILSSWQEAKSWWRTGAAADIKFWRVSATSKSQSVVIDICYDQELNQWQLVRKLVG